ncbi:12187_t:CDS:2 [Ambispora leptoticha]|uniref:12187_t:CDS:1 n=1 Tax=Ambispora leptoticha TaxID=144679 RepID=A0A9N9BWK6_9GLOM|nr:12187_t:CDS:2 [Ambispora leptoticha]
MHDIVVLTDGFGIFLLVKIRNTSKFKRNNSASQLLRNKNLFKGEKRNADKVICAIAGILNIDEDGNKFTFLDEIDEMIALANDGNNKNFNEFQTAIRVFQEEIDRLNLQVNQQKQHILSIQSIHKQQLEKISLSHANEIELLQQTHQNLIQQHQNLEKNLSEEIKISKSREIQLQQELLTAQKRSLSIDQEIEDKLRIKEKELRTKYNEELEHQKSQKKILRDRVERMSRREWQLEQKNIELQRRIQLLELDKEKFREEREELWRFRKDKSNDNVTIA